MHYTVISPHWKLRPSLASIAACHYESKLTPLRVIFPHHKLRSVYWSKVLSNFTFVWKGDPFWLRASNGAYKQWNNWVSGVVTFHHDWWLKLYIVIFKNKTIITFLFPSLRWSCATLVSPVSLARSLSAALWLAPQPTWPQRFCWTRVTTARWTCGQSGSLCMSAWVARFHLTRMKTSTTRSTTQPSCTLPTPGNRSPVMVNMGHVKGVWSWSWSCIVTVLYVEVYSKNTDKPLEIATFVLLSSLYKKAQSHIKTVPVFHFKVKVWSL